MHFQTRRITAQQDYDPLDIMHTEILSEQQSLFLMEEIEKIYMTVDERGMYTDLLSDEIVPELVLYIFMKEFNYASKLDAVKRIKDQEEKRKLFSKSGPTEPF